MKTYAAIFVVFSILASVSAVADPQEYKACMKRCMSKLNDNEKCKYLCEQFS